MVHNYLPGWRLSNYLFQRAMVMCLCALTWSLLIYDFPEGALSAWKRGRTVHRTQKKKQALHGNTLSLNLAESTCGSGDTSHTMPNSAYPRIDATAASAYALRGYQMSAWQPRIRGNNSLPLSAGGKWWQVPTSGLGLRASSQRETFVGWQAKNILHDWVLLCSS